MITFPNAKINIGLNIVSKRADGYHNLQTIFYPLPVKDALEIITARELAADIVFTNSGLAISGNQEDNLCIKAYHLLRKDFPQVSKVKMHLHKAIPMGAGMGGGSADGAFTLMLLNNLFSLHLSVNELLGYALQLGSDCPFFILNQPCFATGRGEIMEPVEINLSAYRILVVNPAIHINTAAAFARISPGENNADLKTLITAPVEEWKHAIINDFEKPVFAQNPEIAAIKEALYTAGAHYASMSGSGSTVFGIFPAGNRPTVNFPAQYFCQWV